MSQESQAAVKAAQEAKSASDLVKEAKGLYECGAFGPLQQGEFFKAMDYALSKSPAKALNGEDDEDEEDEEEEVKTPSKPPAKAAAKKK